MYRKTDALDPMKHQLAMNIPVQTLSEKTSVQASGIDFRWWLTVEGVRVLWGMLLSGEMRAKRLW
jgi:hypothetical protein